MTIRRLLGLTAVIAIALCCVAAVVREATYGIGNLRYVTVGDEPLIEIAFVSNGTSGTISVIDVSNREIVGELNVLVDGDRPSVFRDLTQYFAQPIAEERAGKNYAQDTDLSPDGRTLFVSRGYLGDVAAFDIATGQVIWRTPISGVRSDHMTISPSGDRLYVSALIRSGDVVDVLDAITGKHIGTIASGPWPHDVHVNKSGNKVYIASLGDMQKELKERESDPNSHTITVADTDSLEVLDYFQFDAGVRPFALTSDEKFVFAQLSNTHAVVRYDTEQKVMTHRNDLPVDEGVSEADWDFEAPHHGLVLSPDGTKVCIAGRASDYAAVLSADDLTVQAMVPVGDAPSWIVCSADGRTCIVSNTRSNNVSFVDITGDGEELARLQVGEGPKHITIGDVPKSVLDSLRSQP